ASLAQVVTAFLVAEQLLGLDILWRRIDEAAVGEAARIELFDIAARSIRNHLSDILRSTGSEQTVSELCKLLRPGLVKVSSAAARLIRTEVRHEAQARRERFEALGAGDDLARGLVKLYELDGVFSIAALGARKHTDELALTRAYIRLGEALGLDWAQGQVAHFQPADQWERLLTSGLARDFEQLRIEFLARGRSDDPEAAVERWVERHGQRISQFRGLIQRARTTSTVSATMLAQVANQARILLAR
ncbi:MAG TPA: glutamate dehydrogenase, partial [Novosphingobium sp.]|nr:glutamate dehydrogenase [Novosphingobium sp.]